MVGGGHPRVHVDANERCPHGRRDPQCRACIVAKGIDAEGELRVATNPSRDDGPRSDRRRRQCFPEEGGVAEILDYARIEGRADESACVSHRPIDNLVHRIDVAGATRKRGQMNDAD